MLWTLEETKEDEWKGNQLSSIVATLFERLEKALETGTLPNFFVPQINILADFPQSLKEKTKKKAAEIRANVLGHVPDNIARTVTNANKIVGILKLANPVFKALITTFNSACQQQFQEINLD